MYVKHWTERECLTPYTHHIYYIAKHRTKLWIRNFPYDSLDCQIRLTVNQANNPSVCTHPQMLEKKAWLQAYWFKSSCSLWKIWTGKMKEKHLLSRKPPGCPRAKYLSKYLSPNCSIRAAQWPTLEDCFHCFHGGMNLCVRVCVKVKRGTVEKNKRNDLRLGVRNELVTLCPQGEQVARRARISVRFYYMRFHFFWMPQRWSLHKKPAVGTASTNPIIPK